MVWTASLRAAVPCHHGRGTVLYSWHPSSQFLATVGTVPVSSSGGSGASSSSHSSAAAAAASAAAAAAQPAALQTRCVWIWSMGGTKAKEARDKIIAAHAAASKEAAANPPLAASSAAAASMASASEHAGAAPVPVPAAPSSSAAASAASAAIAATLAITAASLCTGVSPRSGSSGGAERVFQILTPNAAPCIGLEWDASGTTLAILQAAPAHEILLFNFATEEVEHVDLNIKEPTFMRWSKLPGSQQLAIGTGRGELLLYDRSQRLCWFAAARHKKRITCGSWNASSSQFAFASDDRQITICNTADGKTFGQVKVKSKPTNVKFGGNDGSDVGRENIVSVSMDRKTILLYNLDDPENALELAFQQRYGAIVSFKWFREGYIMVGFSLGYLVVISTHMDEIGREQFCARFHGAAGTGALAAAGIGPAAAAASAASSSSSSGSLSSRDLSSSGGLRDIAYSALKHKVATAGESCIKLVDMKDWREAHCEEIDTLNSPPAALASIAASSASVGAGGGSKAHGHHHHHHHHHLSPGALDKLVWTPDGQYISASTRNGCLFVYAVDRPGGEAAMRAQRRREHEESRALMDRVLYKPFTAVSMAACASVLVATSLLSLSHAAGLSLPDLWRMAQHTWSV